MIKSFFECMVKSLVDKPEQVRIEETFDAQRTKITIQVDPQDIGKIIGKEGKTIKALRALGSALSSKENPINVDILK